MVKINNLEIGAEPVLLCTVLEEDVESTVETARMAYSKGADCIELRIDKLREDSMVPEAIREINELGRPPLQSAGLKTGTASSKAARRRGSEG